MLKALGAAGVFCTLSWCGAHRAGWYRRRLNCLLAWQSALLEAERMLCDLGSSTPSYLEWLKSQPMTRPMAERCLELLQEEQGMAQAWGQALEGAEFPLTAEELCPLVALGNVLGRYDATEQRIALAETRARLGGQIALAEEEKRRLSRMWSVLGVSGGLLAVVLLY